jgi:hypothetical protein
VKDIDFAQQQIVVRDGKGSKSRVTMLPTREQLTHTINEFYVKQPASDGCAFPKENRAHFMPIVLVPFAQGKFVTVLAALEMFDSACCKHLSAACNRPSA